MPNKLTEQQRIYVVRRLAAFDKPRAIARDMAREFGVTVSHQLVESYHPGRAAGRRLAPRWKKLFAQARKAFLESLAETGAMYKAVRVGWREGIAHDAWDAGQFKAASDVLDAIAKDIGDAFDKRQKDEHSGRRARPLPRRSISTAGLSRNLRPRKRRTETGKPAETRPDAAPAECGTAGSKKRG